MDWSYDLLSPAEQTLFRRISVFVGGCTLEGVEAVCNTKQDLEVDVLDGMGSLVNNSLVRQIEQSAGEPRFALLDTVREYGLERLAASGEESAIKRAHAAYCLVLAEECASQAADPARDGVGKFAGSGAQQLSCSARLVDAQRKRGVGATSGSGALPVLGDA